MVPMKEPRKIRVCEGCEQMFDDSEQDSVQLQLTKASVSAETGELAKIEGFCPACGDLLRLAKRLRSSWGN